MNESCEANKALRKQNYQEEYKNRMKTRTAPGGTPRIEIDRRCLRPDLFNFFCSIAFNTGQALPCIHHSYIRTLHHTSVGCDHYYKLSPFQYKFLVLLTRIAACA